METLSGEEFTNEDEFIRKFEHFQFRTIATILVITGSHGYLNGQLGLPDESTYWFYYEDCQKVGVKPGPYHEYDSEWKKKVPIITKPAEKMDPQDEEYRQDCFYNDEILKRMDFRVANMGYYYGDSFDRLDSQKLLDDIAAVSLSYYLYS